MNLPRSSRPAALLILAACLAGQPAVARAAGDRLPRDVLKRVKAASVFLIRGEGGRAVATGSGFVFKVDGTTAYIATNEHVVAPTPRSTASRLPPRPGETRPRTPAPSGPVTMVAVFNSGTKEERLVRAEVVAIDRTHDLAVLKVTGLASLPRPLELKGAAEPEETMTVYMFGFPFGAGLSSSKGNPSITVSKGAISALRLDDRKELSFIQIEAEVHPGNSGGPVVDDRGRLLGVIHAKRPDTRFGRAIPPARLLRLLEGWLTGVDIRASAADRNVQLAVTLRLFDPDKRIKSVTFHSIPLAAIKDRTLPAGRFLGDLPGGKKVVLKLGSQKGEGTVALPAPDEENLDIVYQVVLTNGLGDTLRTSPQRRRIRLSRRTAGTRTETAARLQRTFTARELREALADLRSEAPARVREATRKLAEARPGAARRKEVAAALGALLRSSDAATRRSAVRALGVWGSKENVPQLARLVEDVNVSVRAAALEALGKHPDVRGAEAAARRLKSETDRSLAAKALRAMGRVAEKPVLKLLLEERALVLVAACEVLREVGSAASVRDLRALEERSRDPAVTRAARAARSAILARR
jgi:S1-C subfamily serine protease